MLLKLPTFKSSLRVKFIFLLFMLAFLPLLTAMIITIVRLQNTQRLNVVNYEKQVAQTAAEEVNAFVIDQFATLDNIGTIYPEFSDPKVRDILVERILFKSGDFVDLAIVNKEGKEISHKNLLKVISPEEFVDRSQLEEFKIVQEKGRYIGPVYLLNGKPYFIIGKEILGVDRSFQGAAFAIVDVRVLQDVVKDLSVAQRKGRAYIVDKTGKVIAHPDISYVLAEKNFSAFPPVEALIANKPINTLNVYTNEEGTQVLGAGAPIVINFGLQDAHPFDTQWFVIAEQPASEALASVNEITQFMASLLVVVLIFSIVVTLIFTNRIVIPIEKVHAASRQLREGNLNYRLSLKTGDEIEDLATEFNSMASKLQENIKNIEENEALITGERNKLAITLSGITDGVIAVDGKGSIVIFNKAAQEMSGLTEQEAVGRYIDDVITFYENQEKLSFTEYCPFRVGGPEGIVFTRRNLKVVSHKQSFVNLIVGQIKDGSNVNLGGILTLHDIGKEKQLEDLKLDFVAMAAHELRTPITSLRGYLTVFSRAMENKVQGRDAINLNRIKISAHQISLLVENILSVSRIERGVFTLSVEDFDYVPLIKQVIADFEMITSERNVHIQFLPPPQEVIILKADRVRITEVLSNLISNAVNYTPKGGHIWVKVELKDNYVITHVQDDGAGIPPAIIPHLFTKFFRVSSVLEHGSKGTGLGLYISKTIIDLHHGRIGVRSAVNQGSVFSFALPLGAVYG